MSLSTHVLDAMSGKPAAGVAVTLTDRDGMNLAAATTDGDGRVAQLGEDLPTGVYRLHFDTGAYFAALDVGTFYPEVIVAFEIIDAGAKYHVPVLLSPFAYSTYRGS
ncbi:hydroxyisourate hydrolase [Mycolicibacterium sp. P1-18]|uniref:hydroxyisourate hydrolase n=1 Tax=Mycolicibacterium sp. P1-18 TaxID=2024615 RepID=UPI0011F182DF|nr:hydroxyisourate hydrolase [Mycolicibacterium sp. P1-18]KAA0098242.1 hydroxyisourate hydrolase [Mycolicibacterium sp. P1-18]